MRTKIGDFVTVLLDNENTRQGILIDHNRVLMEGAGEAAIKEVICTVPDEALLPETLEFVNDWRMSR